MITILISDITRNILSDYIEYDELIKLTKYISNLYINPERIKVIIDQRLLERKTYIDDDLRKIEGFYWNTMCSDKLKLGDQLKYISHFRKDKREGKQLVYYNDGSLYSESFYKDDKELYNFTYGENKWVNFITLITAKMRHYIVQY